MNMKKGLQEKETIVALSTPPGEGAVSIVRMSGALSVDIARKLFRPAERDSDPFKSYSLSYGHIQDDMQNIVDEVLLGVMLAPKSYTREDVVEINCHGGQVPVKRIIELCCEKGACLAAPGEFTRRAFLNGRIDLSQAEAVIDIIRSKTEVSRRAAVGQLEGVLSEKIEALKQELLGLLSFCELSIDFTEQDVREAEEKDLLSKLKKIISEIKELSDSAEKGIILREGAHVVICGRPNVGKSSLMNLLLRHDRVIVTSIPGTTRDVVQESINLGGVLMKLSDTAGIIDTEDRVEKEGIRRSLKMLEKADIAIFMLDASEELTERDIGIHNTIRDKKHITVLNKTDLQEKTDRSKVLSNLGEEAIDFSVKSGKGLEKLENGLIEKILGSTQKGFPDIMITNLRHKELLLLALEALIRAEKNFEGSFNAELAASDIGEALSFLGEITGDTVKADVLDKIFSDFCIGK